MVTLDEITLPPAHRSVLDRFVALCRADDRIVAAFIGGSVARGSADEHSDLDLYVIASDQGFPLLREAHHDLVRKLGVPLFSETFDDPNILFFILADGVEGELCVAPQSGFADVHVGPYLTLLDRQGVLADVEFTARDAEPTDQHEQLRRAVAVFWHDFSHFVAAIGRGQLWWAVGQLDALRRVCVGLARLRARPEDSEWQSDPYYKLDQVIEVERLQPLENAFGRYDRSALLAAGWALVRFYREQARALTEAAGLPYPAELDRVMTDRLARLAR